MSLPTNRRYGDIVDAIDINQIAARVNEIAEDVNDGGVSLFKGTVPTRTQLPSIATNGEAYLTLDTQRIWIRSSGVWVDGGPLRTTADELPPGSMITVLYNYATSTWPPRPTRRSDIVVVYVGGSQPPQDYIANVDLWDKDVTAP